MTIKEADSIIRAYCAYFVERNEMKDWEKGPQVFSSHELLWSPAKLKYAFFVLAEQLVRTNQINENYDYLRHMYSTIDGTFKEDADEINEALLLYNQRVRQLQSEESPNSHKLIELEDIKFRAKYEGVNPDLPDVNHAGEIEFHNFIADIRGEHSDK